MALSHKVTEQDVWDALAEIADPEIPVISLVDLGVIKNVAVDDGRSRLNEAVDELWPFALGVLDDELRPELRARVEARLGRTLPEIEAVPRGVHGAELAELWEEMTMVRRSAPKGAQW